jgi:hypothetical protein
VDRVGPPPTDPTDGLGELGDFRLLREVGRGGMGIVYEAERVSLGRRVALKLLPMAAAMDSRQIQRFRVEAQAAACLHHPHIVPVHGVGCERGVHYYAMQLIDGRSLAAMIAELRRLTAWTQPTAPRRTWPRSRRRRWPPGCSPAARRASPAAPGRIRRPSHSLPPSRGLGPHRAVVGRARRAG